jgi:hypothetical protein
VRDAVFIGLVTTAICTVLLKMITGMLLAPLATIAVLIFVFSFGLALRLQRGTPHRQR